MTLESMNVTSTEINFDINTMVAKSSDIKPFVDVFNSELKKTALSVLELGLITYRAKRELAPIYYSEFKSQVKYDKSPSTFSKLETIGARAEMLKSHVDVLPSTWTSIYTIASLTNEVFESIVQQGKIRPEMTGAQVLALKGIIKKPKAITVIPHKEPMEVADTNKQEFNIKFAVTPNSEVLKRLYADIECLIKASTVEAEINVSETFRNILFSSEVEA